VTNKNTKKKDLLWTIFVYISNLVYVVHWYSALLFVFCWPTGNSYDSTVRHFRKVWLYQLQSPVLKTNSTNRKDGCRSLDRTSVLEAHLSELLDLTLDQCILRSTHKSV